MNPSFSKRAVTHQLSVGNSTTSTKAGSSRNLRGKNNQKAAPSTEVLPFDNHTREEDTHEDVKEFLHHLKPEDTDEEAVSGSSPVRNQFTGVNRSYTQLKRNAVNRKSRRRSSKPKVENLPPKEPDSMNETNDVSDVELYVLTKTTKFTELEIVSLWNQFKSNFPSGFVNKRQMVDLLKQV